MTAARLTLANYRAVLRQSELLAAMVNSLEVTLIVTVLSVLLAYPFAWILAELVPARWQRLALMLAVLPFWTSYVVRSYSWLLVLAENGVVNDALTGSGCSPSRCSSPTRASRRSSASCISSSCC